jgi:hypothetical protein
MRPFLGSVSGGLLYAGRAPSASHGVRRPEARIYPRYPRYPQVDSAFIDAGFMTAKSRGRDHLPATGDSLPSHSPSRAASRLTRREAAERKAGRLTKPPPGGRWRACPSADAKAAGFVKRPSVSQWPSGRRETVSGGEDLRVQHPAGRKRDLGQRAATGGTSGSGPADPPGSEGLRPGAAKGGPGASAQGTPGRTEASAEDPAGCGTGASALGTATAGSGTQVPNLPSGEPPGLRPCRGARGKP